MKKKINILEYKIRSWFIKLLKPTHFEWSQAPFSNYDGMFILVRDNKCGSNGLGIRFGKLGSYFYYENSYYDGDDVKNIFYKRFLEINPDRVVIMKEFNQNTKAIRSFIRWIKINFDGQVRVINNYLNIKTFN